MDIETRKLHFIQEFIRVADDELVTKLERLLHVERKKKLEREFTPMTMEEFTEIIDKSEDDFDNGRVRDAENILSQIDKWK